MTDKKLPCDECGGQCCTFPVFSQMEVGFLEIESIPGVIIEPIQQIVPYDDILIRPLSNAFVVFKKGGVCPFLKFGRCSIYSLRPRTCRDYGINPELPCQFLYPEEAKKKHDERIERAFRND